MPRGGSRPGAGKPKGYKHANTLTREVARERFTERIIKELDPLIAAQFDLAKGVMVMFAKGDSGKWSRVTSPARIESLLNDDAKENGDHFYYVAAQEPDGRMLDSLMNRAFGRPTETHEHSGPEGGPIAHKVTFVKPRKA